MPRRARVTPGGLVFHVLNRTVAGLPLFRKERDFEAFERILVEAQESHPLRVLVWCLMRNHWHFMVWPREEGEITAHFRWLAHTFNNTTPCATGSASVVGRPVSVTARNNGVCGR